MANRAAGTKERILDAALELFAERGYEPVTVAEIAAAVGIKAPSLYKHYKSKQEIYEAILTEMDGRYREHMAVSRLDGRSAERDSAYYAGIDVEELVRFGLSLFRYYLRDEYAARFRRMLMLSPYGNRELADVFVRRFYEGPLRYEGESFRLLSQAERLLGEDPRIMALHYYAPMFLLLSLCDRSPEMAEEAEGMMERHIRQFVRVYSGKQQHEKGESQ